MKKETNNKFYFYGYWILISFLALIGALGLGQYLLHGSFY